MYLDDYINAGQRDRGAGIPAPPDVREGDGFTFDPDELVAVLAEWERLKADLVHDAVIANRLVEAQRPANEPASRMLEDRAMASGEAFLEHNDSMQYFVQQYVDNLTKARDDYVAQEAAGRSRFHG